MSFDSREQQAEEEDDISWSDVEEEILTLARSLNKKIDEQIIKAERRLNAEKNEQRIQVGLETQNEECKLSIEILIGTRQILVPEPYGYRTRNVEDTALLDGLEIDRLLSEMSNTYREVLACKIDEEIAVQVYEAMEIAGAAHLIESTQANVAKLLSYIRTISS